MMAKEKKHYREGWWARRKKIHREDLWIDLDTYTRVIVKDNEGNEEDFEYACITKEIQNRDRPRRAVHRTGAKNRVAEVQMDPRYPVFDLVDEQGNPLPDHNEFDAQGYNIYARDDRLEKAEQALDYKAKGREYDFQKILTFAAVAVVVVAVVLWFVLK